MAIDRQALFQSLDKASPSSGPPADMPADGGDDYGAGKQLLAAIAAKDPEAVEEAIKACMGSADKETAGPSEEE